MKSDALLPEGAGLRIHNYRFRSGGLVSLEFQPGTLTALIGRSGVGKSTLLRGLSVGYEGPTEEEGGVFIFTEGLYARIDRDAVPFFRSQIAFVPQENVLRRELRVLEVIVDALRYRGANSHGLQTHVRGDEHASSNPARAGLEETARCLLGQVDLPVDRWSAPIADLSGGEKRRVAIARALAKQPRMLFLDEPTAGLDQYTAQRVMDLLAGLAREGAGHGAMTVVCTSHLPATLKGCDRIICITNSEASIGRLREGGHKREVSIQGDFDQKAIAAIASTDAGLLGLYDELVPTKPLGAPHPRRQFDVTDFDDVSAKPTHVGVTLRMQWRVWSRQRGHITSLFCQPIALSLIIVVTQVLHRGASTRFIDFFMVVSAVWLGVSMSVREIAEDRQASALDAIAGMSINSYIAAKMLFLGFLATCSVIALWGSTYLGVVALDYFGDLGLTAGQFKLGMDALQHFIVLMLVALAGTMIGLIVSALAASSAMALYLTPLVVLPHVVFSKYACGYGGYAFDVGDYPYCSFAAPGLRDASVQEWINHMVSSLLCTRHAASALEGLRSGAVPYIFGGIDAALLVFLVVILALAAYLVVRSKFRQSVRMIQ